MQIVIDTGFLSSLLKIGEERLILKLFDVEKILIPNQVLTELEKAPFFWNKTYLFSNNPTKESWIQVVYVEIGQNNQFGLGELACIELAKEKKALLLIDDKEALEKASSEGLDVLDLFGFLFNCKKTNIVNKKELEEIVNQLKEKDYYTFSKDKENELLEGFL